MNRRTFPQSVLSAIGIAPVAAKASNVSKIVTATPDTKLLDCKLVGRVVGAINYKTGLAVWITTVGGTESELLWFRFVEPPAHGTVSIHSPDGPTIRDDGHGNLFVEETKP